MWIWNKSVILFLHFFPFFPSALLLSSLFLSFLWIPQCQLFPSSDRRDSFILQSTCSPSVSERHTHTAIAENTVKVIHTVGQRARMGAGVKTGQNVSTHFCTTRTPTEKEAEPSTGKEARVPEREGLRHRGLPRGPALSQADQWLRPAAGVFRQDHRFQAWSGFSLGAGLCSYSHADNRGRKPSWALQPGPAESLILSMWGCSPSSSTSFCWFSALLFSYPLRLHLLAVRNPMPSPQVKLCLIQL